MNKIVFKKGESVTIGFLLNSEYDMSRIQSASAWVGGKKFALATIDHMLRCELASDETHKLSGNYKLILWIDDSTLGVKKTYVADIEISTNNSNDNNDSTNEGYDFVFNITINETAIQAGDVLYNYVKGDKADLPVGIVIDTNYVHTDNNYDDAAVTEVAKVAGKANSADVYTKSETYTKTEINNKLSAVYKFKGSVLTYDLLPTDAENADVWNVVNGITPELNGMNYAWNSTLSAWDAIGGIVGLATLTENGLMSKEDFSKLANLYSRQELDLILANKQNALQFVEETENKFLRDDNIFVVIPTPAGGYANNLYLGETDSDVSAYKILTYTADIVETIKTVTANAANGVVTAQTFLYPSGVSVATFPSGLWSLKLCGSISASAGVSQVGFSYFKRSVSGVETDLFTIWSEEINNLTATWIDVIGTQPSYTVDPTDRMGLRLLFKTNSATNKTLTYYVGNGYAAFVNNPNQIRHSQTRSKNEEAEYQHITQNQKDDLDIIIQDYYTKTAEENYSYGVLIDNRFSSPIVTRVGNLELHKTLPVQSNMKGCLLLDDGTVNYYLNPTDWTKKLDETASNLTGADGQVMVEIPDYYVKYKTIDQFQIEVRISTQPLNGYTLKPKRYISAYKAALQRSNNKLSSVINLTADFRGGNNNAAFDAAANSFLGKPVSDVNLTNFRTYARNRGNGTRWNCMTYDLRKSMYWLFVIEYANLNSQAAVAAKDAVTGFMQGGLGNGMTTANYTEWNTFNGIRPFMPCGASNSLGNNSGEVNYVATNFGGAGVNRTFTVNRYRGIENPFGDIWEWTDGILIDVKTDASGGTSTLYTSSDPAQFTSSLLTNYTNRGLIARTEGYVRTILFGTDGDILPINVSGGGSTTYYCDNFWRNISANEIKGVIFGGGAYDGSYAGLVLAGTYYAPSAATTLIGSRLCFV